MRITSLLFDAFLKCASKCHLRSLGEIGAGNEYAEWVHSRGESRQREAARALQETVPETERVVAPPATENLKAAQWRLAVDLVAQTPDSSADSPVSESQPNEEAHGLGAPCSEQLLESRLHAVERVPSEGRGKPSQFVPIRFVFRNKLTKDDRLLLAFDALVLSQVLGRAVSLGKITHGDDHATLKVKTSALVGEVRKRVKKMAALLSSPSPPDLVLNRHCAECEFQSRCRKIAVEKDDLSLLAGMSEKERSRHRSKGIFTVTQLSYTFRPRRTPKRAKNPAKPHYFALQALAIREKTVYIHGTPELPKRQSSVYLDIEGLPDRDFYYLIGALVVADGHETFYSFWADNKCDQKIIFRQFAKILSTLPDLGVFHFGEYDGIAMKRVALSLPNAQRHQFEAIIQKSVNVLSVVHPHCYFPTPSNSLKDLAKALGGEWTSREATGLQSIIWRATWETDKNPRTKAALIRYNQEDCLNLKRLCDFIRRAESTDALKVISTQKMQRENSERGAFGPRRWTIDDLQYVTKCAYFDYQREKVFFRTHPNLKTSRGHKMRKRTSSHANEVIHKDFERCPRCRNKSIEPHRELSRSVLDMRFSRGHVKKWVTKYTYWDYYCPTCNRKFNPFGRLKHSQQYGFGLMSWCVYCNVLRGQNMLQIKKTLQDAFDVSLQKSVPYRFKGYVAACYQRLYNHILKAILKSPVLHVDETVVNLRKGLTGYVWVVTSMNMVYYFFKPSREGAFLQDMLKTFSGVLVSDFFAAYDALPCEQQKCLLHLVRDIDDDLLRNPLDEELRCITREFGSLLRTIIETVDRYGLKKRYLHKHKPAVLRFLKEVGLKEFSSELANNYQKRFQKSGARMFSFLDHDGVPWNNTNAEHAIKLFAKYRRNADGRFTEHSLKEYLVLASVFETCEFNNVNVLKFLLSKEMTLEGLLSMSGRKH